MVHFCLNPKEPLEDPDYPQRTQMFGLSGPKTLFYTAFGPFHFDSEGDDRALRGTPEGRVQVHSSNTSLLFLAGSLYTLSIRLQYKNPNKVGNPKP